MTRRCRSQAEVQEKEKLDEVRRAARAVRTGFRIREAKFPVCAIVEGLSNKGALNLEVYTGSEIVEGPGIVVPDRGSIFLREDIYRDASLDGGRGRALLAHAFCHLLVCWGERGLAHTLYLDADNQRVSSKAWQSARLARELLVSVKHVDQSDDAQALACRFGITIPAALEILQDLTKEGIIAKK